MSWAPPQTDADTADVDTIVIEYSHAGRTWSEVARVPVSKTAATVQLPGEGEANASYQLRARSHSDQFGDGRTSDPTAHFSLYPESMLHQNPTPSLTLFLSPPPPSLSLYFTSFLPQPLHSPPPPPPPSPLPSHPLPFLTTPSFTSFLPPPHFSPPHIQAVFQL